MLARPHPVFGDWCYCQPGDSQRLLDRQLSYRDAALRENPQFSGMPPEFEQWCRTSWLPANLGRDFYRKQAERPTSKPWPPRSASKRRLKSVLVVFWISATS